MPKTYAKAIEVDGKKYNVSKGKNNRLYVSDANTGEIETHTKYSTRDDLDTNMSRVAQALDSSDYSVEHQDRKFGEGESTQPDYIPDEDMTVLGEDYSATEGKDGRVYITDEDGKQVTNFDPSDDIPIWDDADNKEGVIRNETVQKVMRKKESEARDEGQAGLQDILGREKERDEDEDEEDQWYRVSKVWMAYGSKSDGGSTPTPFAELRVYLYTKNPDKLGRREFDQWKRSVINDYAMTVNTFGSGTEVHHPLTHKNTRFSIDSDGSDNQMGIEGFEKEPVDADEVKSGAKNNPEFYIGFYDDSGSLMRGKGEVTDEVPSASFKGDSE